MKIAVADLRPNPFRDLERFPLKAEKVDALRRSIHDTSFWDNILVRRMNGAYEIAYGHSRLEALRQEKIKEVDVPVRDLSDTKMAQIMAHENMEEWGASADVETETIRAIVQGYAEGRIDLGKPPSRQAGSFRYAPEFAVGRRSSMSESVPYTAETLADFLGWKPWRVQAALDVLAVAERGVIAESDTAGLTTKQAQVVAAQARRVERETEDKELARAVGRELAEGMRNAAGRTTHDTRGKNNRPGGSVTIHNARKKADEMVPPHKRKKPPAKPKAKKLPPVDVYVGQIAGKLDDVFPSASWKTKLEAVIENGQYVHKRPGASLVKALRRLAERATRYADRLEAAMEMEDAA